MRAVGWLHYLTHPFFLRSFDPHTSFPAFLLPCLPSLFLPSFFPLFLSPPTHHPFISLSIHPSLQLPPSCSSFSLPSGLWTRNSTVGQTSLSKLLTFVHHPLCVWAARTPRPASRRGFEDGGMVHRKLLQKCLAPRKCPDDALSVTSLLLLSPLRLLITITWGTFWTDYLGAGGAQAVVILDSSVGDPNGLLEWSPTGKTFWMISASAGLWARRTPRKLGSGDLSSPARLSPFLPHA